MSISGLLRPENAIFYHPLDVGLVEHTTGDIWSGNVSSVQGKIGQAESAIASTDLSAVTMQVLASGFGVANSGSAFRIKSYSSSGVVAIYGDMGVSRRSKLGSITGTEITWGNEVLIDAEFTQAQRGDSQGVIERFDNNHILVAFSRKSVPGPEGGYVKVGTINGTALTYGPEIQFIGRADGVISATTLDANTAVLMYRNGFTGGVRSKVFTRTGTSGSFGAESIFGGAGEQVRDAFVLDITTLDSTRVLAGLTDSSLMRIGTVSGTDIMWGANHAVDMTTVLGGGKLGNIHLETMDSSHVIFNHFISVGGATTDANSPIQMIEVSGDALTFGSSVQAPLAQNHVFLEKITSTKCLLTYSHRDGTSTGNGRAILATINNLNIILQSPMIYTSFQVQDNMSTRLTDSRFVYGNERVGSAPIGNNYAGVGSFSLIANISGTMAAYNLPSGTVHFIYAFWTKNSTQGISTIIFEHGYKMTLSSGSIDLLISDTDGTLTSWSGASVTGFLNTLNDGSDHLAVIDIDHPEGGFGQFLLKTSLDGNPLVDHGNGSTQDGRTQYNSGPSVSITDGIGSTQWIDELVLWEGTWPVSMSGFTNSELSKLYSLANIFDFTMDKYSIAPPNNIFSSSTLFLPAPATGTIASSNSLFIGISIYDFSSSMNLFISAPSVGNISALSNLFIGEVVYNIATSGDLFITGEFGAVGSGSQLITINRLTKTGDYNPEIIGMFNTTQLSVNIEIWDITSGRNNQVNIQNSGCYRIGDTNTWGWSSEYLPPIINYDKQQYLFRMISNVGDQQFGEFFINVPTRRLRGLSSLGR